MSVIVPNWNGRHLVGACLDSLRAQTHRDLEIVVVDNGSTDGSAAFIEASYPEVRLLANPVNEGYAGGVNRGIPEATGTYVALLNNDAVAEPDWIAELVQAIGSEEGVGIVASKALRHDWDVLDGVGEEYSIWGIPFPRGRDEPDDGRYDEQVEVFAASGSACLIRRRLLDDVGAFDEDFFAYYEDVDLAFRARLRGWRVLYRPTARVRHHVGGTSGRLGDLVRFHSLKNVVYLYLKNLPGGLLWRYLPRFLLAYAAMLVRTVIAEPRGIVTAGRAVGRVAATLSRTLQKRRGIQGRRTARPEDIDAFLYRRMPPIQTKRLRASRVLRPFAGRGRRGT